MTKSKTLPIIALATALGLSAATIATADMGRGSTKQGPSFEELDANADGAVTAGEIQAFGAAKFAEQDANGDGVLDADELLAAMTAGAQERAQKRIARMITWSDQDGDGALSADELPGRNMTMMLSHMDEDGDGQISSDEFDAAKETRGERGGKMRGGHGGKGEGKGHGKGGRHGG